MKIFVWGWLLLLSLFYLFIFWPHGMEDLTSPIRGWTCALCSGSAVLTTGPPLQADSLPSSHHRSQEYWSGEPIPPPGALPDPGIELGSPALLADSLSAELPGKGEVGGSAWDRGNSISKDQSEWQQACEACWELLCSSLLLFLKSKLF